MDLSIVVFDLRDAIEELREERAELLKRIEALEASAPLPISDCLCPRRKKYGEESLTSQSANDEDADPPEDATPSRFLLAASRDGLRQEGESEERDDPKNNLERIATESPIACRIHGGILPPSGTR